MVHAWVGHSVLNCNVFKTKVHNPADRTLSGLRRRAWSVEATAALPLMSGGMAAWLGHAARPCSTRGALIDGSEAVPELSAFVRRRHAMS